MKIEKADYFEYFKSPIGIIKIVATKSTVLILDFEDKHTNIDFKKRKPNSILNILKKELEYYFEGKLKEFSIKTKFSGTLFENKVWMQLKEIPYGSTKSYGEIAKSIGCNNAARAVGNANSKNLLPLIIPCHRVITSNGKIGGYSKGVFRKKWLLKHEKVHTRT